jgi:hypothetical protein
MRSKDSRPVLRGLGDSNVSWLPGEYVLLRDPDKAGVEWAQSVSASIRHGGAKVRTLRPPDQLDPDEAILSGWWPSIL